MSVTYTAEEVAARQAVIDLVPTLAENLIGLQGALQALADADEFAEALMATQTLMRIVSYAITVKLGQGEDDGDDGDDDG